MAVIIGNQEKILRNPVGVLPALISCQPVDGLPYGILAALLDVRKHKGDRTAGAVRLFAEDENHFLSEQRRNSLDAVKCLPELLALVRRPPVVQHAVFAGSRIKQAESLPDRAIEVRDGDIHNRTGRYIPQQTGAGAQSWSSRLRKLSFNSHELGQEGVLPHLSRTPWA